MEIHVATSHGEPAEAQPRTYSMCVSIRGWLNGDSRMAFNARNWLDQVVRTSYYKIPENVPDYGDLYATPSEIIEAFTQVESLNIDTQAVGALLPARIPVDVAIPEAFKTNFKEIIEGLVPHSDTLHPACRHALLALALQGDDLDVRSARLDHLWPLFDVASAGKVYQPSMTWVSLLRPQWFSPEQPVMASVRGGHAAQKEEQGTLTTVALTQGKIRVNPINMFSWALPIPLTESKQTASPATWAHIAKEAWSLPFPPVTSLWLMGMGDKHDFWDFIPAGAALYSPFYTDGEVDALVHNNVQHIDVGQFFRPGTGIADVYPFDEDPVLAAQFNIAPLFDAPMSFATLTALGNLVAHPGCPVSLPQGWSVRAEQQCCLAESLDLLPPYSAFAGQNADGDPVDSVARAALTELSKSNDAGAFQKLLSAVANTQAKIARSHAETPVDAGTIGIPSDTFTWPVGSAVREVVPAAIVPVHAQMESI